MVALFKKIASVELVVLIVTMLLLGIMIAYGKWANVETIFYIKTSARIITTMGVLYVPFHKNYGWRTVVALLIVFTCCVCLTLL